MPFTLADLDGAAAAPAKRALLRATHDLAQGAGSAATAEPASGWRWC
jgi:hypothetical protein